MRRAHCREVRLRPPPPRLPALPSPTPPPNCTLLTLPPYPSSPPSRHTLARRRKFARNFLPVLLYNNPTVECAIQRSEAHNESPGVVVLHNDGREQVYDTRSMAGETPGRVDREVFRLLATAAAAAGSARASAAAEAADVLAAGAAPGRGAGKPSRRRGAAAAVVAGAAGEGAAAAAAAPAAAAAAAAPAAAPAAGAAGRSSRPREGSSAGGDRAGAKA